MIKKDKLINEIRLLKIHNNKLIARYQYVVSEHNKKLDRISNLREALMELENVLKSPLNADVFAFVTQRIGDILMEDELEIEFDDVEFEEEI